MNSVDCVLLDVCTPAVGRFEVRSPAVGRFGARSPAIRPLEAGTRAAGGDRA